MNGDLGRFHGTGKAIRKQPPGEAPGVRDAYDRMLAADPRCGHGKRPGACRDSDCNPAGGAR